MSFKKLVKHLIQVRGYTWSQLMVGEEEFRHRFYYLWRHYPLRIGIAVSGGVDSMALAWLTKSLAAEENMKVHAFIVDHGARPESADEAKKVADIMAGWSFEAHVLRLSWGPDGIPRTGFETAARTARYQALARACVANQVKHVLLGHHSDDWAETVMLRMIASSRAEGLRGMKPTSRLPEAWGIHGAEDLEIGRPFLNVSKARLKRTCREEEVPWFEDPTNADPSYTKRNTVRQLLFKRPSRLPVALQKPSLIEMARHVSTYDTALTEKADELLKVACEVRVNRRTGMLQIELPEKLSSMDVAGFPLSGPKVMLKMLTRISGRVTPLSIIRRRSMVSVVNNIYIRGTTVRFTAAGLLWNRSHKGSRSWVLRRMPHTHKSRAEVTVRYDNLKPGEWSQWLLWDGRWWIRLKVFIPDFKLVLRPLEERDMTQLRKRLLQVDMKWVSDDISAVGTNARFTIPVVAMEERGGKKEDSILVGLPSFDVDLMNRQGPSIEHGRLVQWEAVFRRPI